jgi:hypothetical protein
MRTDGAPPDEGSRPRILAPERQRACAPLVLRVVGLAARTAVRISATTEDRRGRRWRAEATYRCVDTVVDVARDASVAGSYLGVHPDGLLTSMRPPRVRSRGAGRYVPGAPDGFPVDVRVVVGGTLAAAATIDRVLVQPGVTRRRFFIDEETFGVVWQPPDGQRRRPPVVVLAPARSPMAAYAPGLLASRGYPAVRVVWGVGRLGAITGPLGRRGPRVEDLQRGLVPGADRAGIDLRGAVLLGVAEGAEVVVSLAATLQGLAVAWPGSTMHGRWPVGPGRLPGDARDRVSQHTGGATWDLLLDLLRELSISPGPTHADGLTPLVSRWPRGGRGPGRSAR